MTQFYGFDKLFERLMVGDQQKGVKAEGVVMEALPGLNFRVRLDNGHEVLAHLAGKMKINYIRVIPGDRVIVEMPSPADRRGRIVRRY